MQVSVTRCETAEDVRRIARQVRDRRKASYLYCVPSGEISTQPEPPPEPEPAPVDPGPNVVIPLEAENPALIDLLIMTGSLDVDKPVRRGVKISEIQRHVCRSFESDIVEMRSKRRTKEVVIPRHVAMVLCRMLTLHSLPEIGRRFGNRDHTTVLHGLRKYEWLAAKLKAEFDSTAPLSRWTDRAAELVHEGRS